MLVYHFVVTSKVRPKLRSWHFPIRLYVGVVTSAIISHESQIVCACSRFRTVTQYVAKSHSKRKLAVYLECVDPKPRLTPIPVAAFDAR